MDQFIVGWVRSFTLCCWIAGRARWSRFRCRSTTPVLLVMNTQVKHELRGGASMGFAGQCEQAVAVLKTRNPQIHSLRDVKPAICSGSGRRWIRSFPTGADTWLRRLRAR
jgi:galactokinase